MVRRLRYFLYRLYERFYEWRLGIFSDTEIFLDTYGVTDAACHQYIATSYIRFRQLMKLIDIRPGEDVFLDFGSGMGRAVVLAATYPFRKIIGVELIPELNERAVKNVQRALPRLRCRDIELHNVDARSFRVPPEVTVIYFWNPFSKHVLADVFGNIRQSVIESPRTVTIIFLSPPGVTSVDEIKDGLPWLAERRRFDLGPKSVAVIYTCEGDERKVRS
ncbi:MAG: hypothetical protein HY695_31005 [Deltaproteobacteria bacterium]|nr:hypothetical protein [Deltaproteobacteria bacterium]